MFRSTRSKAVLSTLVAASLGTAALASSAGAAQGPGPRPGILLGTYELTASEYINTCHGAGFGTLYFADSSAVMQVDCSTGHVDILTPTTPVPST